MNIYYVYQLLDPRKSNQPFYIGKGKGERAWSHLTEKYDSTSFKLNVIAAIRKVGLEPIVEIIEENINEEDAFKTEVDLIAQYGRRGLDNDGILTNRTKGGAGGDTSDSFTDESLKKMRAANKGTNNSSSKITKQNVIDIYRSRDITQNIADDFNVSTGIVNGIKTATYYKDVLDKLGELPGYHHKLRRIPLIPESVVSIFNDTGSIKFFKEKYNVSKTVVRNIKTKKTWTKITKDLDNPGELIINGLTNNQRKKIQESDKSLKELAEEFNVHPETIRNIRNRQSVV